MSTIYFIGSGQMSEAIIRAVLNNKTTKPQEIQIYDIDPERLSYLQSTYNVSPVSTLSAGLQNAEIIVLGIRPQDDWQGILTQIANKTKPNAILVSLIAGVQIAQIKQHLPPKLPVIRIIPNTLTDTGLGYSGVATDIIDQAHIQNSQLLAFLNDFGKIEHVQENALDSFTGFGVAGPNYIYYFYESFVDAGVLAGLPRATAKKLALENLKGAAAMLEQTSKHPRELLDINNSPAGVGMHGLYELNNSDFAASLQRSVLAAVKRTTQLGQE